MFPATPTRASHAHVRKFLIGTLTALLLFATLVIAPGARAVDQNDADYWEDKFDHPATCYKHDPPTESNPHGTITDEGKAVTLFTFNPAWAGDHWEALIVKAGSVDSGWGPGIAVYVHPSAGVPYFGPLNAGGQQSAVSHWIVCKGTSLGDPAIDIEKATNGFDADDPTGPSVPVGSTVTWTYVVTNTGNVDLSDVVVSDDMIDDATISGPVGDTGDDGILGLTETWTYTATGDAAAGQYENTGSVEGYDGEVPVTDFDLSHYFGEIPNQNQPEIQIEKATNGDDADDPSGPRVRVGRTVTWSYVVKNTGDVPLGDISVTDDNGTPLNTGDDFTVTCPETALAAGESITCTPVTGAAKAGQYGNIATVIGFWDSEVPTSDTDPSHYYGYRPTVSDSPDIAIDKSVVPAVIPVGETTMVTWTIVVTNTGDVTLFNVEVTDVGVPACDLSIGTLAVAASSKHTCTSSHAPPNLAWSFTNVAVTTGEDSSGTEVSDNDDAKVLPSAVAGTAQLGDTVWLDVNKNGVQDSGELGYNGADVILKDADGNVVGTLTTATGAWVGFYKFVGLDAGTYTAMLDLSTIGTYKVSTATAFTATLAEGDEYLDADFGLYEDAAPPTTTVPPEETLPTTGLDSERLTVVAIALLVLGALAVLATRRRRIEDQ